MHFWIHFDTKDDSFSLKISKTKGLFINRQGWLNRDRDLYRFKLCFEHKVWYSTGERKTKLKENL